MKGWLQLVPRVLNSIDAMTVRKVTQVQFMKLGNFATTRFAFPLAIALAFTSSFFFFQTYAMDGLVLEVDIVVVEHQANGVSTATDREVGNLELVVHYDQKEEAIGVDTPITRRRASVERNKRSFTSLLFQLCKDNCFVLTLLSWLGDLSQSLRDSLLGGGKLSLSLLGIVAGRVQATFLK